MHDTDTTSNCTVSQCVFAVGLQTDAVSLSGDLLWKAFNTDGQILGHVTRLDSLDTHCLQSFAEAAQLGIVVQFGPVQQAASPGEDGGWKTGKKDDLNPPLKHRSEWVNGHWRGRF